MHLQQLTLRHIKLIQALRLDFTRDDEPRMWTVIIDPHGTCKTAILQPIALTIAGPSHHAILRLRASLGMNTRTSSASPATLSRTWPDVVPVHATRRMRRAMASSRTGASSSGWLICGECAQRGSTISSLSGSKAAMRSA